MSNKDQKKDQDNKDAGDRTPKVGALLRASRLRVDEDLRDISDILCIRYLYLEAIEECRYADLPGNTYAVGFIRSYAEHLGLDGDEVVRRYRLEQTGQKGATDLAFPTPVPDSGVPKGAIVFIGVLIALLVYGGWYVTTTDDSILSDLISPVPDHLKHLVTGDDAPGNDAASKAADTAPAASGTTGAEVEKVVRETAAAAEQLADAAGEAAQRTAEAAAEAAATASDAVTETAQSATEQVSEAADAAATQTPQTAAPAETAAAAVESAATATDSAAATPAPGSETPAAETAQATPAPASSDTAAPAATQASESSTAAPAGQEAGSAAETAAAPTQPETPAATSEPSATGAGSTSSNTVTSEPLAAPTETPATDTAPTETPATETAAAPSSEPSSGTAASPEVTAEDLNTLVLRQATGGTGSAASTETPPPPETASLAGSDAGPTSGIVIRATSSSWVEIRDPANSTIIFTGLMNAGNSFNVPDIDGLVLDTGNAGALDISIDGEAVPKLGGVGAVRKNVSLNADRLKAGTATNR